MATVKLDPAKGIQIPNLTTTERNAISSPETGAIIWNTTTSEINQYNGSAWEITYTDTNTQIAGITSSADATAITIDASENVGIGVTPESWESKFKVLQVGRGGSIFSPNNNDELSLGSNIYTNTGGIEKYINTDTAAIHNIDTGKHTFKVAASGSADANITWTTGFEVLNDGKARAKNGLLFGTDTAAANALDDYEEGTHTVTVNTGGGSITLSSTNNKFIYTKIGRQVTIVGRLDVSAISSPTGELSFSLPFVVADLAGQNSSTAGCQFVWYGTSGDAGLYVSWADDSESVLYMRIGTGTQPAQAANLARVSTEYRISFSYMTN